MRCNNVQKPRLSTSTGTMSTAVHSFEELFLLLPRFINHKSSPCRLSQTDRRNKLNTTNARARAVSVYIYVSETVVMTLISDAALTCINNSLIKHADKSDIYRTTRKHDAGMHVSFNYSMHCRHWLSPCNIIDHTHTCMVSRIYSR